MLAREIHMLCQILDCGPTNTANGDVDYSGGTTFDTQANITCYLGYHFEGTGTITCLESGMWSSETECVINGES